MNLPTNRDHVVPSGEELLDLFRTAAGSGPNADEPHFVDDEELLTCWSLGEISRRQEEEILDHLARCPYCRHELAEMLRQGVIDAPAEVVVDFVPPEEPPNTIARGPFSSAAAGGPQPAPPGATSRVRHRTVLRAATLALAGSLALGVFISLSTDRTGPEVARLDKPGSDAVDLSEFAERLGSLRDRGYELNGGNFKMGGAGMPAMGPDWSARRARFEAAADEYSDHVSFVNDYGRFLLAGNRWDPAKEQFEAALRLEPGNREAMLGLGTIAFVQEDDKIAALKWFQQAVGDDSTGVAGHVNMAMCLEQLDRHSEAVQIWKKILEISDDVDLREEIELHLAHGSTDGESHQAEPHEAERNGGVR
ncbi:MAG: hypothetical protein HQ581_27510 [Planctomycetes bacterium]|nr:hypothetical protein [Planctomycetota bacterium]